MHGTVWMRTLYGMDVTHGTLRMCTWYGMDARMVRYIRIHSRYNCVYCPVWVQDWYVPMYGMVWMQTWYGTDAYMVRYRCICFWYGYNITRYGCMHGTVCTHTTYTLQGNIWNV